MSRYICLKIYFQADQIEASCSFNLIYDQGAHHYYKQLVLIGTSNVYNAAMEVGLCDGQPPVPIYYFSRAGANLEDLHLGLHGLCKEDYFIRDSTRHPSYKQPRPLNILLFSTCNDIGRPYMDQEGKYVSRMLFKIHNTLQEFAAVSGREVKFAATTYLHAPHQYRFHTHVDKYNDSIRHINRNILSAETYEADNLVVKPLKTGEVGIITIDGKRYGSPDENWRSQNGHHLMAHVLMSYLFDFRIHLNQDFSIRSKKPSEALEFKIVVGKEALSKKEMPEPPKWATAETYKRFNSYSMALKPRASDAPPPPPPPMAAMSANLEPLGQGRQMQTQEVQQVGNKRQSTFGNIATFKSARQSNKQRALIAEKERLKDEATEQAIDRSSVDPDDINNPKWKQFFKDME